MDLNEIGVPGYKVTRARGGEIYLVKANKRRRWNRGYGMRAYALLGIKWLHGIT